MSAYMKNLPQYIVTVFLLSPLFLLNSYVKDVSQLWCQKEQSRDSETVQSQIWRFLQMEKQSHVVEV